MTREEKCKLAIEKGFTYDSETGLLYNKFNKNIGTIMNGIRNNGYVKFSICLNKKPYNLYAHQFAWYWVYRECVEYIDHINGIRNDNRICNLRSVSHKQNQWNRKTAKGYYWHKTTNKWRSQILLNRKSIHLGLYKTEQEARNAYLQAKEKYHII
jgi:hypothetical protein